MVAQLAEPALAAPARERRALAGWVPWTGFAGSLLIAGTAPLWRLAGPTWRITLPFLPHDGSTFEELLAVGDERMYQDKASRRTRSVPRTSAVML